MSSVPLFSLTGRTAMFMNKPQFKQTCVRILSSNYSSSSLKDDSYNYTDRSIIPTDHFQQSLPRLPIPKLEESCQKYLSALQPLLTKEDMERTKKIVENFKDGEGNVLQKALIAKDKKNKHTSYVSGPWFDMYLKDRSSVVLNYNPYIAFNDDPNKPYNQQLVRATNFIISSLRFMKTLRSNILEPEIFHLSPEKSDNNRFKKIMSFIPKQFSWYGAFLYKAFPLDMSQYENLFSSTRIPRADKDEIWKDKSAKHLLVIRNGHHYVFDVLDRDGNIKSPVEILSHLKFIVDDKSPSPEHSVGVLTSDRRDIWAKIRQKLISSGNEDSLRLVDSAIFVLSLEDTESEEPNTLSKLFLFGDPANRWFDKSFTLIMTRTGKTAVNFEHSWGDGVAVLRYFNEVFKDTTTKPRVHPDTKPGAEFNSAMTVRKINWILNDELTSAIKDSNETFRKSTSALDINLLQYHKFGKSFIKEKKLSPDSFMQLGFQMAFFKQYGQTVATYESCSTAAFKHGRTETVRSATMATKKACELFASSNSSVDQLMNSMVECTKVHNQLTKEAAMGKGFDRHLLGLRQTAAERGLELPEIYRDASYNLINHNILSTSTLTSPAVLIGGFAPVVPNGYGVGYAAEDKYLGCNITSYPPSRNVTQFLECIQQSFNEMYEVLNARLPKK